MTLLVKQAATAGGMPDLLSTVRFNLHLRDSMTNAVNTGHDDVLPRSESSSARSSESSCVRASTHVRLTLQLITVV